MAMRAEIRDRPPSGRITAIPGREHYLRRRDRGDGHPAALRHLFNRMLGQLHHCLRPGQLYDPAGAFPHATPAHAGRAAA
jgi:hypothetical protein